MSGAGVQSAGTSRAGYGTSTAATEFGGGFLRDSITNETHGARRINPKTRDYVLDDNNRTLGVRNVKQLVHLAIHTDYDSSAVKGFGNKLKSIDRITSNFEKRVLSVLTEALSPLIKRGLVEVVGFSEFKKGDGTNGMLRGATFGRLKWRDLTTKKVFEEFV